MPRHYNYGSNPPSGNFHDIMTTHRRYSLDQYPKGAAVWARQKEVDDRGRVTYSEWEVPPPRSSRRPEPSRENPYGHGHVVGYGQGYQMGVPHGYGRSYWPSARSGNFRHRDIAYETGLHEGMVGGEWHGRRNAWADYMGYGMGNPYGYAGYGMGVGYGLGGGYGGLGGYGMGGRRSMWY